MSSMLIRPEALKKIREDSPPGSDTELIKMCGTTRCIQQD